VTQTDGGQWAPFVGGSPDAVWVNEGGVDLISNPWVNL
jgi:hypothetical protein